MKGQDVEQLVNEVVLRTQAQAEYAAENYAFPSRTSGTAHTTTSRSMTTAFPIRMQSSSGGRTGGISSISIRRTEPMSPGIGSPVSGGWMVQTTCASAVSDELSAGGYAQRCCLQYSRALSCRDQPTTALPNHGDSVGLPDSAGAARGYRGQASRAGLGVGRDGGRRGWGRCFPLAGSLMVRLLYSARTDVGMIRSGNEDNFAVNANGDRGVFVVADGMGGHAAGEVASEMAVQIIEI